MTFNISLLLSFTPILGLLILSAFFSGSETALTGASKAKLTGLKEKGSKKAHNALGCKGVTRSDFKFFKNKFYLLEINTQPGMTSLSLVPEIARFNNISFLNLIDWIIKDASIYR